MQKVRQAVPDGARARSVSALKNSRFFEKPVAESYAKDLFATVPGKTARVKYSMKHIADSNQFSNP